MEACFGVVLLVLEGVQRVAYADMLDETESLLVIYGLIEIEKTDNVALVRGHEPFLVRVPEVATVRDGDLFVGVPWTVWEILHDHLCELKRVSERRAALPICWVSMYLEVLSEKVDHKSDSLTEMAVEMDNATSNV